jgi:hypothetical protein
MEKDKFQKALELEQKRDNVLEALRYIESYPAPQRLHNEYVPMTAWGDYKQACYSALGNVLTKLDNEFKEL